MEALQNELYRQMCAVHGSIPAAISPQLIVNTTCDILKVDLCDMLPKNKQGDLVECRHIIAFLLDKYTNLKASRISKFLGDRHRTTIIHSIKTCNDLIDTDKEFREKVKSVEDRLGELCA